MVPANAASGMLLRSEPFTRAVPEGGRAWRILYVTTRSGKFATASAIVVVPTQPTGNPLAVIAWAHGTTGIAAGCAPSLLSKPFDNVPDFPAVVRAGWAYVGTDYPGLGTGGGHSYLVGEDAAAAVLDSVRAARQLQDANLSDRVVVWGHSQGGNSALWTGMRASALALELTILGVAALAPASDLKGLVESSKGSLFGKIVSSYLIHAYAQAYPDVKIEGYVGGMSQFLASDIAKPCRLPVSFLAIQLAGRSANGLPRTRHRRSSRRRCSSRRAKPMISCCRACSRDTSPRAAAPDSRSITERTPGAITSPSSPPTRRWRQTFWRGPETGSTPSPRTAPAHDRLLSRLNEAGIVLCAVTTGETVQEYACGA